MADRFGRSVGGVRNAGRIGQASYYAALALTEVSAIWVSSLLVLISS